MLPAAAGAEEVLRTRKAEIMALGTAIVILGIIYFCLVSPGFRVACFCAAAGVGLLVTLQVLNKPPVANSGPPPYSETQGPDRPNPFDEFDRPVFAPNAKPEPLDDAGLPNLAAMSLDEIRAMHLRQINGR